MSAVTSHWLLLCFILYSHQTVKCFELFVLLLLCIQTYEKNIHQNLVNSNSLGLEAFFRFNSSSNYREVDIIMINRLNICLRCVKETSHRNVFYAPKV